MKTAYRIPDTPRGTTTPEDVKAGKVKTIPIERMPVRSFLISPDGSSKIPAGLGVTLEESSTGGGSDGNFTAALGVPTLDGLGAVGEGAHAPNESILINRIADRTALLAKLVAAL